jgi:HAMP domain-containing protein
MRLDLALASWPKAPAAAFDPPNACRKWSFDSCDAPEVSPRTPFDANAESIDGPQYDANAKVQDSWLLLVLLLATIALVVIQSWRLRRQRRIADAQDAIARANQAAAVREESRKVAADSRSVRAIEGEHEARALLERSGYAVLERQVPGSWTIRADGESVTFGLRADYLVARAGRRYIAEVKTGRLAPRLSHGPTRRQLLEYSAAFDVHGVLLVDAEGKAITRVEIDPVAAGRLAEGRIAPGLVLVVAAVALSIGVVAGLALGR